MNYKLNKINKKTTFCTMCFNLGMDNFALMRNDPSRNNYEKYYLIPLLNLCRNFPNVVVYCDKEAKSFLEQRLTSDKLPFIIALDSYTDLYYFKLLESFKKLTHDVYINYPEYKNEFSLYSLNRDKTDLQAVYSILVLNKIQILKEVSELNPFNTSYFAWIDAGCFQDKYLKFWVNWNNKININTDKFKCCVNVKDELNIYRLKDLDTPSIILRPTETIEAIAPFFYIHKKHIGYFYESYNQAISSITKLNLPCTEQSVWTYMLLQKRTRKLFYPVMCDDYNKVISLVATSKEKLSFSKFYQFKIILLKNIRRNMKKFFSAENRNSHKVITILGCKFSFKRKNGGGRGNLSLANISKQSEKNLLKKLEKILYLPDHIEQVEINLTSHCNLNCQMCDHFSPIAEKEFADIEIVSRDLKRLSELTDKKLDRLLLLGGEPLLHPDINSFIKVSREYFPDTEIIVFTNCILLDKMHADFWNTCKEYNAVITYTKYPINLDFSKLEQKAESYGVKFVTAGYQGDNIKTSWKFPLDLSGKQDVLYNFLNCIHATKCINLENGKMYTCTVAPNIRHFNKYFAKEVPLSKADGVDIFEVSNLKDLIAGLYRPIPFCKYCNVDGRCQDLPFAVSKKQIEEWI